MEILVILSLIVLIAFLMLRSRRVEKRRREMMLAEAWRIVLQDPHYEHRKRYEEKLREDDLSLKKQHALLRKKEGLSRDVPQDPPTE